MIATVTPCVRRGSVSGARAQTQGGSVSRTWNTTRVRMSDWDRLELPCEHQERTRVSAAVCQRVVPASTHLLESNKARDEHASRGNGTHKD